MRLLVGRDDLAEAVTAAISACDPLIEVERVVARPVHRGFARFVNDGSIDLSEIALVTLLQAIAADRAVGLLPVTVLGRFQHHTLVTCKGLSVDELPSATVGVRSWTQTTGLWVRGALAEQYGVDLRGIDWVTYEDGHVAGYREPNWVRRAPQDSELVADLTSGRLDAAIIGNDLPAGTGASPVLKDSQEAARQWAEQAGCVPVNHVVGVSRAAAAARPDLVRAAYDALRAATADDPNSPSGFSELATAFDKASAYALDQEILAHPLGFDDVAAPTRALLSSAPGGTRRRVRPRES